MGRRLDSQKPGLGQAGRGVMLGEQQLARGPSPPPPAGPKARGPPAGLRGQSSGEPGPREPGALQGARDGSGLAIARGGSGGRAGRGGPRGEAPEVLRAHRAQGPRRPAGRRAAALTGARASGGPGRRAGAPGRRPRGAWRGSWRRPGAW